MSDTSFRTVQAPIGAPDPRLERSLRTAVRALGGMQKEALVASSSGNRVWRVVSDEGPYLAGTDLAPPPLGFFVTGLVASHANSLLAAAAARGVELHGLRLTQDTYYTMQGSALRGTMTGGALAPVLTVEAGTELTDADLRALAADAVAASPLTGLINGIHESRFTLTHGGGQIPTGRVAELPEPALADPEAAFTDTGAAEHGSEPLMTRVRETERIEGEGGVSSSLRPEQSRTLNARAVCTIRADGTKQIDQYLLSPIGSQFRMLSDETGGAPDALSYAAAGIGFCFMTQLGRYASITKQQLDGYRIVQDTHFPAFAGPAAPVDTHVFIDTPGDGDAVRQMLDMGEQTCFLHALCRTDLEIEIGPTPARSPAGA